MATKTAKSPKLSLAKMIDEHLALADQIEALEARRKELGHKIYGEMSGKRLRSAFGSGDEGYRYSSWTQNDYPPETLEYVRRIKKEHLFYGTPLVTNARLREAFQGGHLTAAQHKRIKDSAGPDYPAFRLYRIRREIQQTGADDV